MKRLIKRKDKPQFLPYLKEGVSLRKMMNNISPEVDNSCINEVSSPVRNLMNKQIAHQIRYTIAGNFNSEKNDNRLGLILYPIDVSFI